ncbi:MAG TPA: peptidylprolyl isomerase [Planctomycetaceae bacterium]|nr:peptidylprolyl isomerase [Planctomycetaceae bacterium]
MRSATVTLTLFLAGSFAALPCSAQTGKPAARGGESAVLVVVNGQNVTEADLQRMLQTRQVPAESREKYRQPFLEEMIDARLIRQFLASKKIVADKKEVDRQVQQVMDLAAKRGSDADKALREMGYTRESLREEFSLPLAWKRYFDGAVTPAQTQKFFSTHRAEFDGTQVRASQIVLRVRSKEESDWEAAEGELRRLRKEIIEGKTSFEDAARSHSQAPSKDRGGDLGFFPYSGKMPATFSHHAFQVKVGEISEPFRDTFGVHLCQVVERKPGDLSLEDVREEVLARQSQELWKETVAEMRKTAKIDWKSKS